MEKINVAELLRNCPSGMKLDCTLVENLYFDRIIDSEPYDPCSIGCYTQDGSSRAPIVFNEYGHFTIMVNSKCVIFPEGKTTWEGFQIPFKDGDIVFYKDTISIFKEWGDETSFRTHVCTYLCAEILDVNVPLFGKGIKGEIRYATEKEKQKLFQAIEDNGYKWNAENKTLEKSVELRFKVGNKIRNIKTGQIHTVTHTYGNNKHISFQVDNRDYAISHEFQDDYELVPDKFDITALVPLESKVLIRDNDFDKWYPAIWGFYDPDATYPYKVIGCVSKCCIPYEGNEHLLGTTDDCNEYFKTWEKTGN